MYTLSKGSEFVRIIQWIRFAASIKQGAGANQIVIEKALHELETFSPCPKGRAICSNRFTNMRYHKYDLAIIIPAYNIEDYIEECILSALHQDTKYKCQLIVIDDGSTDSTYQRIEKFSGCADMHIIHKENGGVASARNRGLNIADSDYIMFLDGDDILTPNAVDALLKVAKKANADIVEGNYYKQYGAKIEKTKELHDDCIDVDTMEISGFPCMKVFKIEIFDTIEFPEGFWYEDSIFRHLIYPKGNLKVCTISDFVYIYRMNPEGATFSSRKKPKSIDSFYILWELYKEHKEIGLPLDEQYYYSLIKQFRLSAQRVAEMPEWVQKDCFIICVSILQDFCRNSQFRPEEDEIYCAITRGRFKKYLKIMVQ